MISAFTFVIEAKNSDDISTFPHEIEIITVFKNNVYYIYKLGLGSIVNSLKSHDTVPLVDPLN
jgi:hypothetical protein